MSSLSILGVGNRLVGFMEDIIMVLEFIGLGRKEKQ
jgi:hypothetical protein